MGLHLCFLKTIFCLVIWSDAQSPQVVSICAGAPSSSPQGRNAAARRLAIQRDQQRERDHHDYRLRADSRRADQRQRPRLLQAAAGASSAVVATSCRSIQLEAA